MFVGFDNPRSLGPHEQGATAAAPIFRDFMKGALANALPTPFRVPPGIVFVPVNRITGAAAEPGRPGMIQEAFKAGTEPSTASADTALGIRSNAEHRPGEQCGAGHGRALLIVGQIQRTPPCIGGLTRL